MRALIPLSFPIFRSAVALLRNRQEQALVELALRQQSNTFSPKIT